MCWCYLIGRGMRHKNGWMDIRLIPAQRSRISESLRSQSHAVLET